MGRGRHKVDKNYIVFTDLMTNLMVIFLFIALSYILQAISENFIKDDIYNTLNTRLRDDLKNKGVTLSPDLTLRFTPEGNANLFEKNDPYMTGNFKGQIEAIWPKYQKIITDPKYLDYIKEIRIEGHADTSHISDCERFGFDNYFCNLELSSKRAENVLQYIRSLHCFQELPDSTRERIQFLLTANGLSYSKTVNDLGRYTYTDSNKSINRDLSRRVEFRIVTSNEKLVKSLSDAKR